MKKLVMMIVTAFAALMLVGCGASESGSASAAAPQAKAGAIADTIDGGLQGKKVLVAYYSWSGNTKAVAEQIQRETGADIFFIQPQTPYPGDYRECVDIAKKEMNENARPAVANTVDNMDQYDIVFVGYPIWWGKAPMFVYTFLESYNFQGKTVVPFCTTGGTPISGSMADAQKSAAGAQLVRGSDSSDPAAVSKWLKDIHAVQ